MSLQLVATDQVIIAPVTCLGGRVLRIFEERKKHVPFVLKVRTLHRWSVYDGFEQSVAFYRRAHTGGLWEVPLVQRPSL